MSKRPSVASRTAWEKVRAPPHNVSRLDGKLEDRRHLIFGAPCATAGAAIDVDAAAKPAAVRNWRRFIRGDPRLGCRTFADNLGETAPERLCCQDKTRD